MGIETDDVARWFDLVQWLHGKWIPEIVLVLIEGPTRFQDLQKTINAHRSGRSWSPRPPQLSNSQLSRTLHAMHRDALILRHEDRTRVPATVTYELAPLFRDFLTTSVTPAADWHRSHGQHMHDIRERHRRRQPEQQ